MTASSAGDALARMLFDSATEPSLAARLDGLAEEVRVARLIAHLRPFLPSSTPTPILVPAQRRAGSSEQRWDDLLSATYRRQRRRPRPPTASPHRAV